MSTLDISPTSKNIVDLYDKLKACMVTDWQIRECAQAKMRVIIRRTLVKLAIPLEKREEAIFLIMKGLNQNEPNIDSHRLLQ